MSLSKKLKLNIKEVINESIQYEHDTKKSQYFLPVSINFKVDDISNALLNIESNLISKLKSLSFKKPVDCVYNPLEYAYLTHSLFVKKYCTNPKKILFLGVNPGPWGMAQTGVPFGEINITRDWLQIEGPVQKPLNEISVRPINGFNCHRSEISGKKFWSLFKNLCGSPEVFFKHSYLHNYCPLLLMKNTGANVTPADLKKTDAELLLELCDESLYEIIKLLKIEIVIGVGRFPQKRAEEIKKNYELNNIRIFSIIHPSPRIPLNENWDEKARKTLNDLNLLQYFVEQSSQSNSTE